MTVTEMQDNFQSKLSKFDDIKGIQYTTNEISRFLTEAQNHLVDVYSERFEFDERVKKYLYHLIKIEFLDKINFTSLFDNSTVYELPEDVKRVVQESASGGTTVKPVKLNYYNRNINNPFKKPDWKLDWRLDIDLRNNGRIQHILIHKPGKDTSDRGYYRIVYIKNPRKIDIASGLNCELHVQTHEDIVNLAVERAVAEARARIELMKENLPPEASKNE